MTAVGCGASKSACVSPPILPFTIHARSSTTGESLDTSATLTVYSLQAPFDTVTGPLSSNPPSLPLVRFEDRSGGFHIHIVVPRYQSFDQDVVVEHDSCNEPKTIAVVATLQPQ
jgi:hypothetical protein